MTYLLHNATGLLDLTTFNSVANVGLKSGVAVVAHTNLESAEKKKIPK